MYEPNAERIMLDLDPNDVVLDIGGWGRPFNRANYVIDAEPYETRGYYGSRQGGDIEHFNAETWIQRDMCERTPYPFENNTVDFVICSQTLEDVRDPLWVCSEMVRIAKRGYLEVPSRVVESCRGVEIGQVGWSHHRWLIDINDNRVSFLLKYHMIHSHWRFSFPERFHRQLSERQRVQWLFWNDTFEFGETTIHGVDNIAVELERFVESVRPYPALLLGVDKTWRHVSTLSRRVVSKLRRMMGNA